MNGKHSAKTVPRVEEAKSSSEITAEASTATAPCTAAVGDDDIVLTEADREFLDYIADVAIELCFARYGAK